MPVWIGGIALALAGFFMVKYSIENNLLSPAVRVMLGAIMGAGIAVLYVISFAATGLYELIPVYEDFMTMITVTSMALVLSLCHGAPIALLGMAGEYLNISTTTNAEIYSYSVAWS